MGRGLDGFFYPARIARGVVLVRRHIAVQFSGPGRGPVSQPFGGFGEGETPLPIPNRAVKPLSADGTWASRPRESRSPPILHRSPLSGGGTSAAPQCRGRRSSFLP